MPIQRSCESHCETQCESATVPRLCDSVRGLVCSSPLLVLDPPGSEGSSGMLGGVGFWWPSVPFSFAFGGFSTPGQSAWATGLTA